MFASLVVVLLYAEAIEADPYFFYQPPAQTSTDADSTLTYAESTAYVVPNYHSPNARYLGPAAGSVYYPQSHARPFITGSTYRGGYGWNYPSRGPNGEPLGVYPPYGVVFPNAGSYPFGAGYQSYGGNIRTYDFYQRSP